MPNVLKGILLAAFAGCCWGSMAVAAQYLFKYYDFKSENLTALRLIGAGILLLALTYLANRKNIFAPFKDKQNIRDICIYGIGLLMIQYTFFVAIEVSNAGTAAIMVGVGPLFIIFYEVIRYKRAPKLKEIVGLCLALIGVSLIVTKGDFSGLNISSQGALWGLSSAAFGAFCTVQPKHVIQRVGVSMVVGWGMVIGGAVACLFTHPFSMDVHWDWVSSGCYFYIVAFGTVAAFWCYLRSTQFILPSITAILGSFEPFSAVALSVLLLGVGFNRFELLGAAAIILNMILLSWPGKEKIAAQ